MMGVNVSVLHKPSDEEMEDAGPRGKKRELIELSAVTTDDRGEYRAFGLKPGEYYIKATDMPDPPHILGPIDAMDWTIQREVGSQNAPL